MRKKLFMNLAYFLALTLIMGIAVSVADQVGSLVTFSPDTVAKSGEVNSNFSTIANSVDDNYSRLPIMWSQVDVELTETLFLSNSPAYQINSIGITTPSSGFLVITGSTVMLNAGSLGWEFYLTPFVNGVAVPDQIPSAANDFAAKYKSPNSASQGSTFTLSYTVTVPIAAGVHTVSQYAGPQAGFPAKFGFNKNYLTVVFYPDSQGTLTEFTDTPS